MASTSRIQQCSVAFACILLSLFTSSTSANPIPWEAEDKIPIPWVTPTPTETPRTAEGFHFKLSEDILVNATKDGVLKPFTFSDRGNNQELFSEANSGLDIYAGIFRPSTGYYFLSTLVHVAVLAQEENSTNNAVEGEKEPRVTVSICINNNCGNSAVLRSSSVIPSSGELHTFTISGMLCLTQGQQLTVQVQNHSSTRQVVISKQSAFNAYLMDGQKTCLTD